MRKLCKWLCILFSAVLAVSLAACNGTMQQGGGDEPINVELPADTEATLVALVDNDASEKTLLESLAAKFNETYTNITIQVIQTSDVVSYIRSGDQVDIMQVIGENVDYYQGEGLIADLHPYMDATGFDESLYYDSMLSLGRVDDSDSIYMLARDYSRIVCFYDKDIFDACEVDYPKDGWTWDQFLQTCNAIKNSAKFNSDYTVVQASMSYDILNWGIVSSYGVTSLLNDDYSLTTDETVKANWQKGMQTAADMIASGYSLNSNSYAADDFQKGAAAMALVATPSMKSFVQNEINFDVVSFPAIGDTPKAPAGTSGYSIAQVSENKNAAWAFLDFIMSEEGQEIISATGGMVPVLRSLAESETASWRSMTNGKGQAINTEALLLYPERDVVATWFDGLPSLAQNAYKGFYNTFLKDVCNGTRSFLQGYTTLQTNINTIRSNYPEYFV